MTHEEAASHIRNLLQTELLMSLATTNSQQPWAAVVHFVADQNFNLFWRSDSGARHSRNLATIPMAAATITAPLDSNGKGIGIQASGTITVLAAEQFPALQSLMNQKLGKPENETKPLPPTSQWYQLTPSEIHLIHEPLLGYKRFTYL